MSRSFIPIPRKHFLRRPLTEVFETLPHDVALSQTEAVLCHFKELSEHMRAEVYVDLHVTKVNV